jgi:hypothetical protein
MNGYIATDLLISLLFLLGVIDAETALKTVRDAEDREDNAGPVS